jgi:hypothetical protein
MTMRGKNESPTDLGMELVCETCESELDFLDDGRSDTGVCRQCGIAFLIDVTALGIVRVS